MTQEQRSSIENGIWLCQTHSRLIDVNSTAYPTSLLHKMKAEHEQAIKLEMEEMKSAPQCADFIAIGPDIVFVGELVAVEESTWSFLLDHFVIGELGQLVDYIDGFGGLGACDKFVLVNDLGDGRELSCPPAWSKSEKGTMIKVDVLRSFPRIDAHRLPMDLALSDEHDLFIANGQLARVRGVDSLPQKIKTCLSTVRGEIFYAPTYGTRIREYSTEFFGSPWLPKLIKLETIRMASIPYSEKGANAPSTPLKAVRKVMSVDQVSPEGDDGWFTFRFYLDVEGIGPWIREIKLFISRDL
ncbi:hypothetical protein [Pseudomonas sp. S32]|uniref:hypothetical protein n=1 Tax=Pseudomonas sp. S32 TaxID=2767448 RepID=UPI001912AA93|nr:hypothetical protein [Pseudomonas sp. S32]